MPGLAKSFASSSEEIPAVGEKLITHVVLPADSADVDEVFGGDELVRHPGDEHSRLIRAFGEPRERRRRLDAVDLGEQDTAAILVDIWITATPARDIPVPEQAETLLEAELARPRADRHIPHLLPEDDRAVFVFQHDARPSAHACLTILADGETGTHGSQGDLVYPVEQVRGREVG